MQFMSEPTYIHRTPFLSSFCEHHYEVHKSGSSSGKFSLRIVKDEDEFLQILSKSKIPEETLNGFGPWLKIYLCLKSHFLSLQGRFLLSHVVTEPNIYLHRHLKGRPVRLVSPFKSLFHVFGVFKVSLLGALL